MPRITDDAAYPVLGALTDDDELLALDGGTLLKKPTAANVGKYVAGRLGVFNVLDYGAVGDGVTDDTAAIQAAIDAASAASVSAGAAEVVIPTSSAAFIFTTITVKANVRLRSTGGVLKFKDNTAVSAGTSYYPINNANGVNWYDNVEIIGLRVDGNSANNSTFTVCDSITVGGDNVRVEGCYIKNSPDSGIMFSRVTRGRCVDNRIETGRDAGIYVNDGNAGASLADCLISGNIISGFNFGGIVMKRVSSKVHVSDNVIFDCGNGITLEHASTTTDYSTNVEISNNRLRYIGYIEATAAKVGIILRGSDHVVCMGNRVEDAELTGISIAGSRYSSISGNVISFTASASASSVGILSAGRTDGSLGTTDLTITANVITSPKSHGVHLKDQSSLQCSREIISSNVVRSAGGSALRIEAVHDDVIVVGNELDGAIDVQVIAGATGIRGAANHLVNGVTSGTFAEVKSKDGAVYIGTGEDASISRLAAGVLSTAEMRATANLRANTAGGTTGTLNMGSIGAGTVGLLLGGDVHLYRQAADVLAISSGDSFNISGGAWNTGTLRLGVYHLWVDSTGDLRIKSGAPTSDTDGTVVGTQT